VHCDGWVIKSPPLDNDIRVPHRYGSAILTPCLQCCQSTMGFMEPVVFFVIPL
jgi:hypothetical protein